jgi:hypothetical protein
MVPRVHCSQSDWNGRGAQGVTPPDLHHEDLVSDYEQIFNAITSDSRYARNLDWGKPRGGHPEGTVRAHIAELEENLEALRPRLSESDCWRLRILIHTHDTFKKDADPHAPISARNSHASLARAFLAEFCDDPDMLATVQYHDEPFALWRQVTSRGRCNETRLGTLCSSIRDWDLFLAFLIIDGCTKGKSRDPLRWFFQHVSPKAQSGFSESDIL